MAEISTVSSGFERPKCLQRYVIESRNLYVVFLARRQLEISDNGILSYVEISADGVLGFVEISARAPARPWTMHSLFSIQSQIFQLPASLPLEAAVVAD